MKTVTRTALSNVRQNRGRNILTGVAVALTTLLIFILLTVGYSVITVRAGAVNKIYPTWHIMFRQVSWEDAEALKLHEQVETAGLRSDLGQITDDDADIILLAMDDTAIKLNKMKIESGNFPKKENEIVLSQGILDEFGMQAKIGDEITLPYQLYEKGGMGYEQQDTFRISGFVKSSEENVERKQYSAITSMAYMEKKIPEKEREYRVMFRLLTADKMTIKQIEDKGKEIGKNFGVSEANIVDNEEYLWANYVEPSSLFVFLMIILIVIFAGVLTIYSIYYVSMIPKVQEYGKLKAMGATKKQIRQIVLREGMLVTAIAIPAGLVIGSLVSKGIIMKLYSQNIMDKEFMNVAIKLLENGDVKVLHVSIYLIAIVSAFVTVFLSLIKPMRTAALISPVEAMRYGGEKKSGKKERKGYRDLNVLRLTKANLSRNKKRTAITVATLGATGVLFMVVATVLSCARPKEIAKVGIESDYSISIDSSDEDKMHPEQDWSKIQQNNPIDDEFISRIEAVPGVLKVNVKTFQKAELLDYQDEGENWNVNFKGLNASYAKELEKGEIKGCISYEELKAGDKVVMNRNLLRWIPELEVGDSLRVKMQDGDEKVERTFEIAAIGEYTIGFGQEDFFLPGETLLEMSQYNLNDQCEITVDKAQKEQTYAQLKQLADSKEYLKTYSYEEEVAMWEKSVSLISVSGYTFLIILGGIGIMNLINTMINSIYTRKRELGMMQAIGLSEKQLIRMLQIEGAFYTLGTLAVSVGLGSAMGYGVFSYAKETGMFNITTYHYPLSQTVILAAAVAIIQILLTYMISRNFRKLSLIERVRYAE